LHESAGQTLAGISGPLVGGVFETDYARSENVIQGQMESLGALAAATASASTTAAKIDNKLSRHRTSFLAVCRQPTKWTML
jgi:hypothetical protein